MTLIKLTALEYHDIDKVVEELNKYSMLKMVKEKNEYGTDGFEYVFHWGGATIASLPERDSIAKWWEEARAEHNRARMDELATWGKAVASCRKDLKADWKNKGQTWMCHVAKIKKSRGKITELWIKWEGAK